MIFFPNYLLDVVSLCSPSTHSFSRSSKRRLDGSITVTYPTTTDSISYSKFRGNWYFYSDQEPSVVYTHCRKVVVCGKEIKLAPKHKFMGLEIE